MSDHQSDHFDTLVIGSGPGGQKAAVQAAKAGRRVGMIEAQRKVGGACVYQGTIPSKTLMQAALMLERFKRNAAIFEAQLRPGLEVGALMQRLDHVLGAHGQFITAHLEHNGIHTLHGRARLTGENTMDVVALNGSRRSLSADLIVLATGSTPRQPPNVPIDHEHILDSDSILSLAYLPRSLTVLGGGVIACEYASIFSLLGVDVTMIDRAPRPLMFLDPELTGKFLDHFRRDGGQYCGEQTFDSVAWDGAQVVTRLPSGERLAADKMLVALGRAANVTDLGLDSAGIRTTERGYIEVDADYRTANPRIYAVGDLIGPPALASCSMEQGRRAVCHAYGIDPGHPFNIVPIGIYAIPEMASVGLTEPQARERFGDILVGRARFDEIARGQIAGIQDGLLKLVSDAHGRELLGVHMVGDGATDLIHIGEMALLNRNEVSVFRENVFNFPTMTEAYRVAALNLLNQARRR